MERIQKPLLEVSDLSVSFRMYDSGLEQKATSGHFQPQPQGPARGNSGRGRLLRLGKKSAGLSHFGHPAGQRHRVRLPYGLTENL